MNKRQRKNEKLSEFNKEIRVSLSKEINLELMFKNAKAKNPELTFEKWVAM